MINVRSASVMSPKKANIWKSNIILPSQFLHPRQKVGLKTRQQLDSLEDLIEQYEKIPTIRLRNKIQSFLMAILNEAQPESEYSATVATVIRHDESYRFAKNFFQNHNWWSNDLQQLEHAIEVNAFEIS